MQRTLVSKTIQTTLMVNKELDTGGNSLGKSAKVYGLFYTLYYFNVEFDLPLVIVCIVSASKHFPHSGWHGSTG